MTRSGHARARLAGWDGEARAGVEEAKRGEGWGRGGGGGEGKGQNWGEGGELFLGCNVPSVAAQGPVTSGRD